MSVRHVRFRLAARPRGFHLVTPEILEAVGPLAGDGILQVFIRHTSAGLTINENADPDVRHDYGLYFERLAPENLPGLRHTLEGPDDMPAHVKSTLTGHHVSVPFADGRLLLGTWQGIYLCEFRNRAGARECVGSLLTG